MTHPTPFPGKWDGRYPTDMENTIGAVLAGGKGTRMGADKAFVSFRGAPMISHVAESIRLAGLQVLVVGREIAEYESVRDADNPGGGPLVGLLTALRSTGSDVFLTAVDQPLLRPETVLRLLEQPGDAVVPFQAGHPQVTCSVFRAACLDRAETLVASGEGKLRLLIHEVTTNQINESTWTSWGEDGRSWLSLDTPDAVQRAEALR